MKVLLFELRRVYKKAPIGISLILIIDSLEIILLSLNPLLIGLCIDGLLKNEYSQLCWLISFQLVFILIRAINKFSDTRVYERIIESESNSYYEDAMQSNSDDSQISSRLNLVDEIPSFFDIELVETLDVFGGILISLIFILFYSGLLLFSLTIAISVLVCILTNSLHKEIADRNIKLQDHDETREKIVLSRNIRRFRMYTKTLRAFRTQKSDLEAKAYLITDLLQAGLLVVALILAIHIGNYTSGQLFTITSYIILLNDSVCEINKVRVDIYALIDTATRLGRS